MAGQPAGYTGILVLNQDCRNNERKHPSLNQQKWKDRTTRARVLCHRPLPRVRSRDHGWHVGSGLDHGPSRCTCINVQRASWARHCQPWLAVHLSQLGHVLPAQALPDRASEEGQALPAHIRQLHQYTVNEIMNFNIRRAWSEPGSDTRFRT